MIDRDRSPAEEHLQPQDAREGAVGRGLVGGLSDRENVYPAEIEKALYQHPSIHMCAVIGLPDAKWGEVGKACVVLKPNQSATEEELLKFMTERLAKYKVPKSVSFMEALPISAAGKILKRELREQWIVNSE